jgi:hypothetical protein
MNPNAADEMTAQEAEKRILAAVREDLPDAVIVPKEYMPTKNRADRRYIAARARDRGKKKSRVRRRRRG